VAKLTRLKNSNNNLNLTITVIHVQGEQVNVSILWRKKKIYSLH